jgi:hypothetical protein
VEYWRDMSISPKILEQASESLRKIRNSARFILGNIGDAGTRAEFECVPKDKLGLVSRCKSTTLKRGLLYTGRPLRDARTVRARANCVELLCSV